MRYWKSPLNRLPCDKLPFPANRGSVHSALHFKMKTQASVFCILSFFCFETVNLHGQVTEEDDIVISAGYGFPNLLANYSFDFFWTSFGFDVSNYEGYADYNTSAFGPIFFKSEFMANDQLGVALSAAYSYRQFEFTDTYFVDYVYVDCHHNISFMAYSVLIRVNRYIDISDKIELYFGTGLGYRASTTMEKSNCLYYSDYDLDQFPVAFEEIVGLRYYITENIGLYAEAGLAKAPFQIGIFTNVH